MTLIYGNIAYIDKRGYSLVSWRKMKPFKQIFFVFFVLLYLPSAKAIYLDWSGFGKIESFYQGKDNHSATIHFALNSKLHIKDSLSVQVRFDIVDLESSSPWKGLLNNSSLLNQKGFVFLYQDFSSNKKSSFPFVIPSQFYLDYKSEFATVRLGRAPYHFGLGINYLATENPFNIWMSNPDQISVYMVYEKFYIQPSVFYQQTDLKKVLSALLQGGIEQEDWKAAFLYEYPFETESFAFAELYGEYEEKNWSLKSSFSYLFRSENSFALAFEGLYNWSTYIPLDLELKAGVLNKESQFHPQYNLSLLLQNRWMREGLSVEGNYNIASAQIQNSLYFAPSFSFSLFEEALKIQPLFLLAHSFTEKEWSYEGNLSGKYKLQENLFFNLQTGVLYQKEWDFGLLAQAAVSF